MPDNDRMWSAELSAMARLREQFDSLPEEARARVYLWLGDSLGLAHVFPASHPAAPGGEVPRFFQPPQSILDMLRESARQAMRGGTSDD